MNYWPARAPTSRSATSRCCAGSATSPPSGTRTAAELYGARGWVAHHNSDAWAFTEPVGDGTSDPTWSFWPFGGVWLARHLVDHAEFTGTEIDHAVVLGAARFLLDWLVELPTARSVPGRRRRRRTRSWRPTAFPRPCRRRPPRTWRWPATSWRPRSGWADLWPRRRPRRSSGCRPSAWLPTDAWPSGSTTWWTPSRSTVTRATCSASTRARRSTRPGAGPRPRRSGDPRRARPRLDRVVARVAPQPARPPA